MCVTLQACKCPAESPPTVYKSSGPQCAPCLWRRHEISQAAFHEWFLRVGERRRLQREALAFPDMSPCLFYCFLCVLLDAAPSSSGDSLPPRGIINVSSNLIQCNLLSVRGTEMEQRRGNLWESPTWKWLQQTTGSREKKGRKNKDLAELLVRNPESEGRESGEPGSGKPSALKSN